MLRRLCHAAVFGIAVAFAFSSAFAQYQQQQQRQDDLGIMSAPSSGQQTTPGMNAPVQVSPLQTQE